MVYTITNNKKCVYLQSIRAKILSSGLHRWHPCIVTQTSYIYMYKYKNQSNKLWNEVGMEVLKSTCTSNKLDDRAGMTTTSRHPELHLFDRCRDVYCTVGVMNNYTTNSSWPVMIHWTWHCAKGNMYMQKDKTSKMCPMIYRHKTNNNTVIWWKLSWQ